MECKRCHGSGKEPDWRALGIRVRTERVNKGLGLREVARAVRVSASFLSDLELGRRSWEGTKARAVLTMLGVRAVA